MMIQKAISRWLLCAGAAVAICAATSAQAANSYTGTVGMLEVWSNGNVAFTLNGVAGTCGVNNNMVVNKSSDGGKNMYAALLAAKLAGRSIRVSSSGCGPAENYSSLLYVLIDYLYVND